MLRSSAVRSVPLLSRFAPRAGLVTLRQTFARRCHGDIGRPQNDGRKRSLPLHHSALSDCCERGRCVPASLTLASLHLMKSLAVGRAVAHMNPPAAVPQITGADT